MSTKSVPEKSVIRRLSGVSIIGNSLLAGFKLIAGILGHSAAMTSDAVHSLSDVFTTFIAFLGVRMSGKKPDKAHPYGHDRFECVASLLLAALLTVTGAGIGFGGVKTIVSGNYDSIAKPSAIALAAAIVSIAVKEAMFWYTRYYAKRINSPAFMADAWHHRSDAFSSVGSLVGIGGAMLGVRVLEPIACVAICLFIFKVSYDILKDAISRMTDTSCDEGFEAELSSLIRSQEGVIALDQLHTRKFGSKIYIDAEIAVDGTVSLTDAHEIALRVHDAVEETYPAVKHIMIHENPAEQSANDR